MTFNNLKALRIQTLPPYLFDPFPCLPCSSYSDHLNVLQVLEVCSIYDKQKNSHLRLRFSVPALHRLSKNQGPNKPGLAPAPGPWPTFGLEELGSCMSQGCLVRYQKLGLVVCLTFCFSSRRSRSSSFFHSASRWDSRRFRSSRSASSAWKRKAHPQPQLELAHLPNRPGQATSGPGRRPRL